MDGASGAKLKWMAIMSTFGMKRSAQCFFNFSISIFFRFFLKFSKIPISFCSDNDDYLATARRKLLSNISLKMLYFLKFFFPIFQFYFLVYFNLQREV